MRIPPFTRLLLLVALSSCSPEQQAERSRGEQAVRTPAGSTTALDSSATHISGLLAALAPSVGRTRMRQPSVSDVLQPHGDGADGVALGAPCPAGMLYVEGMYCPEVEHKCTRWLETEGKYAYYRCAEYARPARCLAQRRHLRFCIDRDEYVPPGESLPASHQSWTDAKRTCESLGKRVCMESEFNFACEGEEMRPYPYGFTRDSDACNADRTDIYKADGMLRDLRDDARGHPRCTSPFGVHHLAGNLEEWTTIDGSNPPRPAMKGAYWQPSRNHCRAAQTAHDNHYSGVETGFRCCGDPL